MIHKDKPLEIKSNVSDTFTKKNLVSSISIILIALVVVFLLVSYRNVQSQKTTLSEAFVPKKTEFQNVPPPNFPKEIPLEKNTKLTHSYLKEYENSTEKSLSFSSEKSTQENITFYKDTFKQEGWKIIEDKQLKGRYFLSAKKDRSILNISIFDIKMSTTTQATSSALLFSKIHSNIAIRIMTTLK